MNLLRVVVVTLSLSCPDPCGPMDHSSPGSSVRGILQARTLEWGAISSARDYFHNTGIKPASLVSPTLVGGFFTTEPQDLYLWLIYRKKKSSDYILIFMGNHFYIM